MRGLHLIEAPRDPLPSPSPNHPPIATTPLFPASFCPSPSAALYQTDLVLLDGERWGRAAKEGRIEGRLRVAPTRHGAATFYQRSTTTTTMMISDHAARRPAPQSKIENRLRGKSRAGWRERDFQSGHSPFRLRPPRQRSARSSRSINLTMAA